MRSGPVWYGEVWWCGVWFGLVRPTNFKQAFDVLIEFAARKLMVRSGLVRSGLVRWGAVWQGKAKGH